MVRAAAVLGLVGLPLMISAQKVGSPERRPPLDTWKCTSKHGCVKQKTSIVLDALTHPIHKAGSEETSCLAADGTLNTEVCPDKTTCAKNCVLEGITDYAAHGVVTRGGSLTLTQYLEEDGALKSVSPRVYLVAADGKRYNSLRLRGQEFTFDVDVSALPCGMNGALYLSEMLEDGGRSKLNPAGASYGTGYCDAQCFNLPFINGAGNVAGHGSCCNEMDIWEANARAMGYTPHACNATALYECTTEEECGQEAGVCDKWGCGFNPYALGNHTYYGYRMVVDTTKPFTVVTQFGTDDGTTQGVLSEIRRLYIQDGQVIQNAVVQSAGTSLSSITDEYCAANAPWFESRGGLEQMGRSLGDGMVLAMSIWNDAGGYMQWLDGGDAGPCNATEGAPSFIEQHTPDTEVTFSNIRFGDIGSTFRDRTHHF